MNARPYEVHLVESLIFPARLDDLELDLSRDQGSISSEHVAEVVLCCRLTSEPFVKLQERYRYLPRVEVDNTLITDPFGYLLNTIPCAQLP